MSTNLKPGDVLWVPRKNDIFTRLLFTGTEQLTPDKNYQAYDDEPSMHSGVPNEYDCFLDTLSEYQWFSVNEIKMWVTYSKQHSLSNKEINGKQKRVLEGYPGEGPLNRFSAKIIMPNKSQDPTILRVLETGLGLLEKADLSPEEIGHMRERLERILREKLK